MNVLVFSQGYCDSAGALPSATLQAAVAAWDGPSESDIAPHIDGFRTWIRSQSVAWCDSMCRCPFYTSAWEMDSSFYTVMGEHMQYVKPKEYRAMCLAFISQQS
jgi:hypothetical protein